MLTYAKASKFVETHDLIQALKREIACIRPHIKELKSFIRQSGGEQMNHASQDLAGAEQDLVGLLKDLNKHQTTLNNLKYGE